MLSRDAFRPVSCEKKKYCVDNKGHHAMIYKYGQPKHDFWGVVICI